MTVLIREKNRKVLMDIPYHRRKIRDGIKDALYDIGYDVEREIRRLIKTGPKTGRFYRRPGGRIHQASAPGESPANDTGTLAASADYKVYSWSRMEVGVKASYGIFLERGTYRMARRPYVGKAVNNKAGDAVNHLDRNVRRRVTGKRS